MSDSGSFSDHSSSGQSAPQPPAGGYPHQPGYPTQPGYPPPGQYANYPYDQQYGGYAAQQKSKIAAGLLGIFLGGLGIHRFYLGYTTIGVIQLVLTVLLGLFTFGLVGLWGFIEGIMILCGAQSFRTDAKGIPLRD
ncbi:TM2 domain-containing protein [Arthrobacter mobilis]|uniref:TM2 domain-containing protein n=1 Tax=Arthrobacter mobilis TaxID=2724944 RepID=A0A7X6HEV7_9MICC|nr:TM2 domain-containing protein [Arthrobacter mobilis]NKX54696.1 TM2 domain-containing protein [Arthrobacter mobilis]